MANALLYLYVGLTLAGVLVCILGGILLVGYIASGERDRRAVRNALFLIATGVLLVVGTIYVFNVGFS